MGLHRCHGSGKLQRQSTIFWTSILSSVMKSDYTCADSDYDPFPCLSSYFPRPPTTPFLYPTNTLSPMLREMDLRFGTPTSSLSTPHEQTLLFCKTPYFQLLGHHTAGNMGLFGWWGQYNGGISDLIVLKGTELWNFLSNKEPTRNLTPKTVKGIVLTHLQRTPRITDREKLVFSPVLVDKEFNSFW